MVWRYDCCTFPLLLLKDLVVVVLMLVVVVVVLLILVACSWFSFPSRGNMTCIIYRGIRRQTLTSLVHRLTHVHRTGSLLASEQLASHPSHVCAKMYYA
jgi:hypothetical protein